MFSKTNVKYAFEVGSMSHFENPVQKFSISRIEWDIGAICNRN
jgi:hypothetical protein